MTEDLKILLDEASSSGSPPMAFSADDVVTEGRRRAHRRTALAGSGLAVLTALAVGAGVVLNGGGGGPSPVVAGSPSESYSSPAPQYSQPVPDGKTVGWNSYWVRQDATGTAISDALAAKLKELYPDVRNVLWGPGATPADENTKTLVDPASHDSSFRVDRFEAALVESFYGEQAPPTNTVPIYRSWSGMTWPAPEIWEGGPPFDTNVGIQLVLDGKSRTEVEALRVSVFPKGTYVEGFDDSPAASRDPKGGHLVSGCDDQSIKGQHGDGDTSVTFECGEFIGPNGEQGLTAERTIWWGGRAFIDRTAVLYRADGTAVVIGASASPPLDWKQGQRFDETPGLGMDDVTELALAVPPVTF